MARNRQGQRRIDHLSWGRLARIYNARSTTADIRKAIENAARRCGYKPAVILGLNRWN
ncbi:MAG: hypothetical protein IT440_03720 [Phycisphaeraceae bacterium]|nr:hypothetical protein [Phycisphaeraceae bacterium]